MRSNVHEVVTRETTFMKEMRGDTEAASRHGLFQLLEVLAEDLSQPRKSRVPIEVRAHVAKGARHVLNVNRIGATDGLEPECAQGLQVPLDRHQIEPAPELFGRRPRLVRIARPTRPRGG